MIKDEELLEKIYYIANKYNYDMDLVQDFVMGSNAKMESIKNLDAYVRKTLNRMKYKQKDKLQTVNVDIDMIETPEEDEAPVIELDEIDYPVLSLLLKGVPTKEIMELTPYKTKQSLSNRKKREILKFRRERNEL